MSLPRGQLRDATRAHMADFLRRNPGADGKVLATESGMHYEEGVRTHLRRCGFDITDQNRPVYRAGRSYTAHDGRFAPDNTVGAKTVLEIKYSIHPEHRERVKIQLLRQLESFPDHHVIVFCEVEAHLAAMESFFLSSRDVTPAQKQLVVFVGNFLRMARIISPHRVPMDE